MRSHTCNSHLITIALFVAVLPGLGFGCGEPSASPTTYEITALEQAHAELAQLIGARACRIAWDCPQNDPGLARQVGRYESREACLNDLRELSLVRPWRITRESVEAGRQMFDIVRANTCITTLRAHVQTRACAPTHDLALLGFEHIPACARFTRGAVVLEGACITSEDCADADASCYGDQPCEGVCLRRETPLCGSVRCGSGQRCDESDIPTCVTPSPIGATCTAQQPCMDGSVCVATNGSSTATCVANESLQEGEACHTTRACVAGLSCDARVCTAPPYNAPRSVGEGCSPYDEMMLCRAGLVCTHLITPESGQPVGTCDAARAEGEPCQLTTECAPGQRCLQGACAAYRALGEPCEEGAACAPSLDCGVSGVCELFSEALSCRLNPLP